jgi:hypothetical protein
MSHIPLSLGLIIDAAQLKMDGMKAGHWVPLVTPKCFNKLPYYTASITKGIFNKITLKKFKTFS